MSCYLERTGGNAFTGTQSRLLVAAAATCTYTRPHACETRVFPLPIHSGKISLATPLGARKRNRFPGAGERARGESTGLTLAKRERVRDQGRGRERRREGKRRTTAARVCLRREFMYAREALFTGDNRGVGLEIHTNLSDLRSFA